MRGKAIQDAVIQMLQWSEGKTITQIMAAAGGYVHTVRGTFGHLPSHTRHRPDGVQSVLMPAIVATLLQVTISRFS